MRSCWPARFPAATCRPRPFASGVWRPYPECSANVKRRPCARRRRRRQRLPRRGPPNCGRRAPSWRPGCCKTSLPRSPPWQPSAGKRTSSTSCPACAQLLTQARGWASSLDRRRSTLPSPAHDTRGSPADPGLHAAAGPAARGHVRSELRAAGGRGARPCPLRSAVRRRGCGCDSAAPARRQHPRRPRPGGGQRPPDLAALLLELALEPELARLEAAAPALPSRSGPMRPTSASLSRSDSPARSAGPRVRSASTSTWPPRGSWPACWNGCRCAGRRFRIFP